MGGLRGELGWRNGKQGSCDLEASHFPTAYQSSNSLHKLSAGNSFDSLPGTLAEDELLSSSRIGGGSGGGHRRQKCRQAWEDHRMHVAAAFMTGVVLAYFVFSFSLGGMHHNAINVPKVIRPSADCKKAFPAGIGLSPLALANQTGNQLEIPDHLIVAARHSEDTSWLDTYLSDIPHVVYQVDDPENTVGAQHATLKNKGNEAMGYLQFIIDYYDKLPASMVFLHGHRSAWHMLDVVPILQRLRWGHLKYAPLRYKNSPGNRLDWKCGDRTEEELWKQFDCDWEGALLRPGNMSLREAKDVYEVNKDLWVDSMEISQVWPQAFQEELGDLPVEMQAPCCSTFMVSRERIVAHPLSFYVHLRDWIIRTEMNSYRTGRMMEYVWHIIFGEAHIMEAVKECDLLYCAVTF